MVTASDMPRLGIALHPCEAKYIWRKARTSRPLNAGGWQCRDSSAYDVAIRAPQAWSPAYARASPRTSAPASREIGEPAGGLQIPALGGGGAEGANYRKSKVLGTVHGAAGVHLATDLKLLPQKPGRNGGWCLATLDARPFRWPARPRWRSRDPGRDEMTVR